MYTRFLPAYWWACLFFLVMCFGVAIIITAVDIIRNDKEETEDDAFSETEIAEGN